MGDKFTEHTIISRQAKKYLRQRGINLETFGREVERLAVTLNLRSIYISKQQFQISLEIILPMEVES